MLSLGEGNGGRSRCHRLWCVSSALLPHTPVSSTQRLKEYSHCMLHFEGTPSWPVGGVSRLQAGCVGWSGSRLPCEAQGTPAHFPVQRCASRMGIWDAMGTATWAGATPSHSTSIKGGQWASSAIGPLGVALGGCMGQGEGLGGRRNMASLHCNLCFSSKGFRVSSVSLLIFRPPLLLNLIICLRDYKNHIYTRQNIPDVVLTSQAKPLLPWPATFWKHTELRFPNLLTPE